MAAGALLIWVLATTLQIAHGQFFGLTQFPEDGFITTPVVVDPQSTGPAFSVGKFPQIGGFAAGLSIYDSTTARFYFVGQMTSSTDTHYIVTLEGSQLALKGMNKVPDGITLLSLQLDIQLSRMIAVAAVGGQNQLVELIVDVEDPSLEVGVSMLASFEDWPQIDYSVSGYDSTRAGPVLGGEEPGGTWYGLVRDSSWQAHWLRVSHIFTFQTVSSELWPLKSSPSNLEWNSFDKVFYGTLFHVGRERVLRIEPNQLNISIASGSEAVAVAEMLGSLSHLNQTVDQGGQCDVSTWQGCEAYYGETTNGTFMWSSVQKILTKELMFSVHDLHGVYQAGKTQFGEQAVYRQKLYNLLQDELTDRQLQNWAPILEESPVVLQMPQDQTAQEDETHVVEGLLFADLGKDSDGEPADYVSQISCDYCNLTLTEYPEGLEILEGSNPESAARRAERRVRRTAAPVASASKIRIRGKAQVISAALGSFLYRAEPDWNGEDHIYFSVQNELFIDSATSFPTERVILVTVQGVNDEPVISQSWPFEPRLGGYGTTISNVEESTVKLKIEVSDVDITRGEGSSTTMAVTVSVNKGLGGGRLAFPELSDPDNEAANNVVNVIAGTSVNSVSITFAAPIADMNRILADIEYTAPSNPTTTQDGVDVLVNDLGNHGFSQEIRTRERNLKVQVNCFFASPPLLFSAIFDDSAARILVTFDRETDKTLSLANDAGDQLRGRGPCSKVLLEGGDTRRNDTTAWLGKDSVCYWVTATVLAAQCGTGATVEPFDELRVVPSRIRACEIATEATQGSVSIKPPNKPPQPTVSLIGVTKLGVCENAVLDATLSTGSGGRALKYRWRLLAVASGDVQDNLDQGLPSTFVELNDQNATALRTQFAASEDLDTISVDGSLGTSPLPADHTFMFQVGVLNYLNLSSCYYDEELLDDHCKTQGVLMMYKSPLKLPQLYINGETRIDVIRPTDVNLQATSVPSSCAAEATMEFEWSMYDAPGSERRAWPVLDSKTKNTRSLRIRKNTLEVGSSYTLRLFGKMENDPPSHALQAFVTLTVVPAALKALIAGGDRAIPTTQPLVLDATKSIDPDNSSFPFSYNWTCQMMPDLNPCQDKLEVPVVLGHESRVTIPARTFRINLQVVVTVLVSKTGSGMLPDSTSVTIDILPAGPPKVVIQPLEKKKQNSNEKLVILGGVESEFRDTPEMTYKWSILNEPDISLSDASNTGISSKNLVIKQGQLSPGVTYNFQLVAEDGAGGPGRGSIQVDMNSPPTGGEFSIEPTEGIACVTEFTIRARNWVDVPEDFPLQYFFGFLKAQIGTGEKEETALTPFSQKNSVTARFPAGDGDSETLWVTGNVRDVWNGNVQLQERITVRRPGDSAGNFTLHIVNTQIQSALRNGDANLMGQLVDGLADLLNSEDAQIAAQNDEIDVLVGSNVTSEQADKYNEAEELRKATNMLARDELLKSMESMALIVSLDQAAIDRNAKTNGRVLAGQPAELSEDAQQRGIDQMEGTVGATADEGLGDDTAQAAGSAMGGALEALNGNSSTSPSPASRRLMIAGVIGSASTHRRALTAEQERQRVLAGKVHGSTGALGGSANAGSIAGEAPAPILSDAIKVNTEKMFAESLVTDEVLKNGFGPPMKCSSSCPDGEVCDVNNCTLAPRFFLPKNFGDLIPAGSELGSQSSGWGENPFGWSPDSAGMEGDVSGFGLGISVKGLDPPILVKMPLKGDDPTKGSCAYWDEANEMWSTQGCVIGQVKLPWVYCYCTHLTDFGSIQNAPLPDLNIVNPLDVGSLDLSFGLGSILAIIVIFTAYTTYGFACYYGYKRDEALRTAAAMVTGKIVMRPDGTYLWVTEDDVFAEDAWEKSEEERIREEKVKEQAAKVDAMKHDIFNQNKALSNRTDLEADWNEMEDYESSSGDELDVRGNRIRNNKEKKRTKIDDMKDELADLLVQIDATEDEYDQSKLRDKYEQQDYELTTLLLERDMDRRVCWICLHSAPVSRLVKCCGCQDFLEFSHLSCLIQYQKQCANAEWGEFCVMCAQRYEPHVPKWVQKLQVKLLEHQTKPRKVTTDELEEEKQRREVLDREILDMVDNKLYLCWICLRQDDFSKLLTPCKCDGFLKHCHEACLAEWVQKHDELGEENTALRKWGTTCNHCGDEYKLKAASGPLLIQLKDKLFGTDATSRGMQVGDSFEGTNVPMFEKWKTMVWTQFTLLHPILNIAYMPAQDKFTRPMRSTVLLCTILGGLVSGALIYGKAPPTDILAKIISAVITSAIMIITPLIFRSLFIIGSGAEFKDPSKRFAVKAATVERETAYARQLRMAHEARMSKMNIIQKQLYLLKNPAAAPPPDPDPPKRKPIPFLVYVAYGGATIHHVSCAMLVLMYGMTFDPDVANEWLGMSIFTTLNDWFITKPISFLKAATVAFILIEFAALIVEIVERGFTWLQGFLADKCNIDLRWLDVKT